MGQLVDEGTPFEAVLVVFAVDTFAVLRAQNACLKTFAIFFEAA